MRQNRPLAHLSREVGQHQLDMVQCHINADRQTRLAAQSDALCLASAGGLQLPALLQDAALDQIVDILQGGRHTPSQLRCNLLFGQCLLLAQQLHNARLIVRARRRSACHSVTHFLKTFY